MTDPAESARRVNEGFLPLISGMAGFVAYYFIDAGNSVMVSTSVFENQEDAAASNDKARAWVAENLSELAPNPPQISVGEVVAAG